MRKRTFLVTFGTLIVCAVGILALSVSVGLALAQATPGALGDLIMPTSTPGGATGGFAIPTATPGTTGLGGLVIPTATPIGGGVSAAEVLPRLSDAQLQALNISDAEMGAPFNPGDVSVSAVEDIIAQLEAANMTDVADAMRTLSQQYGWSRSVGIGFAACDQSVPVSYVSNEIAQLASVDHARAFVDDPLVLNLYSELSMSASKSTSVHGLLVTGTAGEGSCFDSETSYMLVFEYWGLVITVSVDVNSSTDPALATNLLDQLAGMTVAKVNALAGSQLPPTPAPGVQVIQTPVPPVDTTIVATQDPFGPLPTPGSSTGFGADTVSLAAIDAVMPAIGEVGLPTNTYALNTGLSQIMTREQTVAFFQEAGLPDLANAVASVLQKSNNIGQAVRVWDTAGACPDVLGISVEVDAILFQDASGPGIFLNDQQYKDALAVYGTQFQTADDGGWYSWFSFTGDCGDMTTYSRSAPFGRYVISSSVIAYAAADTDTIVQALDQLVEYTAQKIQQAGLE